MFMYVSACVFMLCSCVCPLLSIKKIQLVGCFRYLILREEREHAFIVKKEKGKDQRFKVNLKK